MKQELTNAQIWASAKGLNPGTKKYQDFIREFEYKEKADAIKQDYLCTCNTYKDGKTDEELYNDLLEVVVKHDLHPELAAETLKLLLISVLEMKHSK